MSSSKLSNARNECMRLQDELNSVIRVSANLQRFLSDVIATLDKTIDLVEHIDKRVEMLRKNI